MILKTRKHGYFQNVGRQTGRRANGLLPAKELDFVMRRERTRCERAGRSFSMLVFSPRGRRWKDNDQHELVNLLRQRLRITDDVGEIDARRIGVVLPDTAEAGAGSLASDVLKACNKQQLLLDLQIYVYSQQQDSDRGDKPGSSTGERQPSVFPDLPLAPFPAAASAAHPMTTLFARQLPVWKRGFDLLAGTFALALAAPIILIAGLLIKLTSPGPVFFRQRRAGLGGKPFTIYKLRTMRRDAEEHQASLRPQSEQDGPAFKMRNDPRTTRVGRVLRALSIDELPQLWNVLWGDMSIVGPRPLPCDEAAGCLPWQRHRLDVTPGLTCIWQVHGRNRVSFADWVRMDIQYIQRRGFLKDIQLVLQTVPAVCSRKGAS